MGIINTQSLIMILIGVIYHAYVRMVNINVLNVMDPAFEKEIRVRCNTQHVNCMLKLKFPMLLFANLFVCVVTIIRIFAYFVSICPDNFLCFITYKFL